jgi:hypothetical protein
MKNEYSFQSCVFFGTMGQMKKKQYAQSREELMMMCIGDVIQVNNFSF